MESEPKHFQNDQVKLTVIQQPGCQVQFDVTLSPEACRAAQQEAIKQVQKKVSLPGFRKGKAPANMVTKHFAEAIDEEWRDAVAQAAFRASLQLSGIHPWNMEQATPAKIESVSNEEGAVLSFRFEREPQVPEIVKESLELPPKETIAIEESTIETRLEGIREHHGTFEEVEKSIEEGDYVIVSAESLETDPPQSLVEDARLLVVKGKLPSWLYRLLLGKAAGDADEAETTPEDTAGEEERKNFRPIKVRVAVTAIEKLIPPSEEALCKATGTESLQALRERLQSQLQREAEGQAEQKRRDSLWQQLLQTYPLELPETMVQSEKRRLVRIMVNNMRQQHTEEAILRHEREIDASAATEAVATLNRFFLARALVAAARAEPSEQEIVTRAVQLMIQDQTQESQNEAERKKVWQLYRDEAFYQLLIRRAENYLLGISEPKSDE